MRCNNGIWHGLYFGGKRAYYSCSRSPPIIFAVLSVIYFTKFNYTTPLQTAAIFVAFVIAVDVFVVALLIQKSFEMFTSLLGTWIPFALILLATYLMGLYLQKRL